MIPIIYSMQCKLIHMLCWTYLYTLCVLFFGICTLYVYGSFSIWIQSVYGCISIWILSWMFFLKVCYMCRFVLVFIYCMCTEVIVFGYRVCTVLEFSKLKSRLLKLETLKSHSSYLFIIWSKSSRANIHESNESKFLRLLDGMLMSLLKAID